MDNAVTQHAYNVGKSNKLHLDIHRRYTGKCRLTARDFYPELAEVSKGRSKPGHTPHPLSAPCYTGPTLCRPTPQREQGIPLTACPARLLEGTRLSLMTLLRRAPWRDVCTSVRQWSVLSE